MMIAKQVYGQSEVYWAMMPCLSAVETSYDFRNSFLRMSQMHATPLNIFCLPQKQSAFITLKVSSVPGILSALIAYTKQEMYQCHNLVNKCIDFCSATDYKQNLMFYIYYIFYFLCNILLQCFSAEYFELYIYSLQNN